MNFEFADKVNPDLEQLDFLKALQTAETALLKLPGTDFHAIIGKPFTDLAADLVIWIDDFYVAASPKTAIKALYFELNEFDINTDVWFIDAFGYTNDGGLDPDDMDWLADFTIDSRTVTGTVYAIPGCEKLQSAFASVKPCNSNVKDAKDWCGQLIIIRFMELMRAAHLLAKEKGLKWSAVPIYFTEHGYDFVVRAENK